MLILLSPPRKKSCFLRVRVNRILIGVRLYLCRLLIENKRLAPYPCESFLRMYQPSPIDSFRSGFR